MVNAGISLATSCEELTHWKRLWCWERLGAEGEGDDKGWDVWMAWPTQWTWVWINSGSWWWTGRPGMLWFMGSQIVRHDWAAELKPIYKTMNFNVHLVYVVLNNWYGYWYLMYLLLKLLLSVVIVSHYNVT